MRAAWLSRCSAGKGMGQQGQAVLSHGSWRKATTWGTHVQAAWESAVPPAVNLTSLPFKGGSKNSVLQKYGTRLFDLLVGLISNQLVWIIGCHLLYSLLLFIWKSFVWKTEFWFSAFVSALESRAKEHYHGVSEVCRSNIFSEMSDFCSVEVPD